MQVEILREGLGLPEAPVWDAASGSILYADAIKGGAWRLDPVSGEPMEVVPHRKGIGGMALHAAGGVVVSGRDIAWRNGEQRAVLIPNDPAWGFSRFNDLGVDPHGRIYAGALDYDPARPHDGRPGKLFVADLDGSFRVVEETILVPNGVGFSPAGDTLYIADTRSRTVWAYDVDSHGDLHNRRAFARTEESEPDGLAVAADGSVWVALRSPGGIGIYDRSGLRDIIRATPDPEVTSLCFGGPDLKDLYITTAHGGPELSSLSGSLYRLRVDTAGLPRTPARVPVKPGNEEQR